MTPTLEGRSLIYAATYPMTSAQPGHHRARRGKFRAGASRALRLYAWLWRRITKQPFDDDAVTPLAIEFAVSLIRTDNTETHACHQGEARRILRKNS